MPTNDTAEKTDEPVQFRHQLEKPTVPVMFNLPEEVADRAIAAFQHTIDRVERGDAIHSAKGTDLEYYIWDEFDMYPVFFVGGGDARRVRRGRRPRDVGIRRLRRDCGVAMPPQRVTCENEDCRNRFDPHSCSRLRRRLRTRRVCRRPSQHPGPN